MTKCLLKVRALFSLALPLLAVSKSVVYMERESRKKISEQEGGEAMGEIRERRKKCKE